MKPQNLESYLRWRGDVPLAQDPFNACDNLVLSNLAYYDFSALTEAATPKGIPLREACVHLGGDARALGFTSSSPTFLETLCASERLGGLTLRNYVDEVVDGPAGTQFCAMEFVLPDNSSYLAFRGTDTTLVGWREDFEISFKRVPAQTRALSYLQDAVCEARTYRVGGHSKGAHLALYATAFLDEARLAHVERVYLNDGPGLCADVLNPAWPAGFRRKVVRIAPQYSVFGRLFEPPFPTLVVRSSETGMMQHSLGSWQVADGGLDLARSYDPQADGVAAALDDWLERVGLKERERFVDELFGALFADGARSIEDLSTEGRLESALLRMVGASERARATAVRLPARVAFGRVADELRTLGPVQWLMQAPLAHGLELVALGLFFMLKRYALPIATSVVLGAVVVALVVELLLRLFKDRLGYEALRPRIRLCLGAAVLFATTLVKEDALFVYGSVVLAVCLLVACSNYGHEAFRLRRDRRALVMNAALSVVLGVCGLFVLVAPQYTMAAYELALGGVFVLCGVLEVARGWPGREGLLSHFS